MRRAVVLGAKIAVLALIGIALAWRMDIDTVRAAFRDVQLALVALAFVLLVVQLGVAAKRWMLLLRLGGLQARGLRYFAYFGMGSITNLSVPGGVAGDVFRVWQITRDGSKVQSAANAVILDRVVALASLGLLVVVCVIWQASLTGLHGQPIRLVALGTGLCILMGVALLAALEPALRKLASKPWPGVLHSMSLSTRNLLVSPSRERIKLLLAAVAAHLILVAGLLLLARAFNVSIGLGDALVVFPIVLLVSSVPITPGGWGVREGAMAVALAPLGVPLEVSVGVSVTYGILAMGACLPAVLVYLALRDANL